jgi:Uma2 family endonuclease
MAMLNVARRRKFKVGPEDNGRRMSLDDFDRAIAEEGYIYELAKGVIEVSDVPKLDHGKQVQEIRNQLVVYQVANDTAIEYLSAGSDAKLLIGPSESERHPDLLIYCSAAPDIPHPWSVWIPEIVIEVVSKRSRKRDYEEKPDEYLEFGVEEYWIVDAAKQQMTVLSRWRGQWKPAVIKPSQKYSTHRLPGFKLDLKRVFAAAKKA